MSESIKVVYLPVNDSPQVREIPNTLETLQKAVDGYIEAVTLKLGHHNYTILVNEEGRLKGLSPNLYHKTGVLVGNALFTKSNSYGDFVSLDDDDVHLVKEWIKLSRLAIGQGGFW
ncbi:MAG: DUF3846 domain-containing protein [Firmicutes bacterium]|nr:DUF3846 domain-containing protein [Bacillota bacterium]